MVIQNEKDFMDHFDSLSPGEQKSLLSDLKKRQKKDPSTNKTPGAPASGTTGAADFFNE